MIILYHLQKDITDIILPKTTGHITAIKIIINYLKLMLNNVSNNENGSLFTFLNKWNLLIKKT